MTSSIKKSAIVILSGGLDSTVTLYQARSDYSVILALTFDYGQRAASREIASSRELSRRLSLPHRVLSLPWLTEISASLLLQKTEILSLPQLETRQLDDPETTQKSADAVWVPNRNGLFINIAACFAESFDASWILTGFNREEAATFPDNSASFVCAINESLGYSTRQKVKVVSLTQDLDKTQILQMALDLQVPLELIWSCYDSADRMCGICESCSRLRRAFQQVLPEVEGWKQFFRSNLP